jgi:hypothetical protein
MTLAPEAWVVDGARFVQVPDPEPEAILALATGDHPATIIIGRS